MTPKPVPEAHALSAFRVLKNGEARKYTATTFPRDPWQGCERFIRTGFAVGCLREWHSEGDYAVLDVLDEDGSIVQDFAIPSADAFKWVKRTLNLAVEKASDA